jgi:tRNA(fMet)-specific endonuclease VapC
MLDTDTCIFITRQNHPKVADRFRRQRSGHLGMSVVTYGEVRAGAENSNRSPRTLQSLEQFIQTVPVLAMEPEVAHYYSQVRLDLQRRGQIIGANDLWIAAHCLQLGLTLVTNNEREFSRIPNLAIENWTH